MFTVVRNTPAIYSAFGFGDRPAIISLMLFQQIIAPVDHVVGFLHNCLSRRYEFQADKFAVDLNYAKELSGGLVSFSCPTPPVRPGHVYTACS